MLVHFATLFPQRNMVAGSRGRNAGRVPRLPFDNSLSLQPADAFPPVRL
jgi:hypothetical protein